MIKLVKKVAISLLLLLLISCSHYTKYRVLKPAEINIGSSNKIGVLNFTFSGIKPGRTYKVKETDVSNPFFSQELIEKINTKILENGHFNLIEREKLSTIMSEQGLSSSGFVNPSDSIKLGQLSGVQVILTGSATYNIIDSRKDFPYFVSINESKAGFYFQRDINLNLSYRVIDVTTGMVIGSKSIVESLELKTDTFPEDPKEVKAFESFSKGAYYELYVYNKLPEWESKITSLITNASSKLVNQIAPHYIEVEKEIRNGNSQLMKDALEMSKKELWANAVENWQNVLSKAELKSDHENALYNLGMYYEISGNLNVASDYYNQAYQLTKNSSYNTLLNSVNNRKGEIYKLSNQGRNDTEAAPKNVDHLSNAINYYNKKDYDNAINAFKLHLMSKPNDDNAHYYLGVIYNEKKDINKAISELQEAIGLNSKNAEAYFSLGNLYLQQGKSEEGRFALKEAFKLKPELASLSSNNSTKSNFELGKDAYDKAEFSKAIVYLKAALKDNPRDVNAFNYLGAVYLTQQNGKDAEELYKRAILFYPDNGALHFNLAISYDMNNEKSLAKIEYKKACDLGVPSACER
jgi:tetratricopeptide (TPR) repeat protein